MFLENCPAPCKRRTGFAPKKTDPVNPDHKRKDNAMKVRTNLKAGKVREHR
jgi:hypothetical protein